MKEVWKDVKGFDNYQVSNMGRFKSKRRKVAYKDGRIALRKEKILKEGTSKKGYSTVYPMIGNKKYTESLHRLVAKAFIPNPENKPQVNHKDGNKKNNKVSNLEWMTNEENYLHAAENGLLGTAVKVDVYDIEENFLNTYPSMAEAARRTGTDKGNVAKVMQGKANSAKGFIFKPHEKQE